MFSPFPPRYRYSRETPALDHPLSADEVVAHLREHLTYEAHNHRFFRARSVALAAEVDRLRVRLEAAGVHPGGAPGPVLASVPPA